MLCEDVPGDKFSTSELEEDNNLYTVLNLLHPLVEWVAICIFTSITINIQADTSYVRSKQDVCHHTMHESALDRICLLSDEDIPLESSASWIILSCLQLLHQSMASSAAEVTSPAKYDHLTSYSWYPNGASENQT